MKIGILGAGVSGLSIARLLGKQHEVELLERGAIHGGIARTREVDGVAYHVTGGHCFNSKYPEVLDFVFNEVLPADQWHQVSRNAAIRLQGHEISYPIEFAVKEIGRFDQELAIAITRDFLAAPNEDADNLEEWFRQKFGNTLSDLYFIPYNAKIWHREPAAMSPAWVEGKLPIPDKRSFFNGLISEAKDKMPHASFYYPNSNNQNTFIDSLAKGLKILTNYTVTTIKKNEPGKWLINQEREYDLLISTLPLNILPSLMEDTPAAVLTEAEKLSYNKVATMLWETTGTERTWTYVPEAGNLFHRYIHIGNFFRPVKNYSITEAVGERTYEEMAENGKKDPFLIKPVAYQVSDHAYVVFDEHYTGATRAIKAYLDEIGLYTLGRFGEWEYYNMDVCIKSSMNLAAIIKKKFDN
jgi:protoporphyrinogen oxidase